MAVAREAERGSAPAQRDGMPRRGPRAGRARPIGRHLVVVLPSPRSLPHCPGLHGCHRRQLAARAQPKALGRNPGGGPDDEFGRRSACAGSALTGLSERSFDREAPADGTPLGRFPRPCSARIEPYCLVASGRSRRRCTDDSRRRSSARHGRSRLHRFSSGRRSGRDGSADQGARQPLGREAREPCLQPRVRSNSSRATSATGTLAPPPATARRRLSPGSARLRSAIGRRSRRHRSASTSAVPPRSSRLRAMRECAASCTPRRRASTATVRSSPSRKGTKGRPLSPYALSKKMNEELADVFGRTYGVEFIGLRYFNVYGPRQDPNGPYAAVIPRFFSANLKKRARRHLMETVSSPAISRSSRMPSGPTFSPPSQARMLRASPTTSGAEHGRRSTTWREPFAKSSGEPRNRVTSRLAPGDVAHSLADLVPYRGCGRVMRLRSRSQKVCGRLSVTIRDGRAASAGAQPNSEGSQ